MVSDAAEHFQAGTSYVEVDKDGHPATHPPETQQSSPSLTVKEIYERATHSVLVLFSGVQDTSLAELEIHQYNEDIRDIVRKENQEATVLQEISNFIDLKTIKSNISLRKQHEALHARDVKTLSPSEERKSAESTKFLGQMGSMIEQFNIRKGYPLNWNWEKEGHPGLWISKPSDTINAKKDYPPGQTKDGATILGCFPSFKLNHQGEEYVYRCKFAIEVDEEESLGSMKIATWAEVGLAAGQAYLDQPSKEQRRIPYSEARYTTPLERAQFEELLGFCAEYSPTDRWGIGYCWIQLVSGDQDVISKSCFEKIVGKDVAIAKIYELFGNDESKYTWRTKPTGLGSKDSREGPYGPVAIQRKKMIDNGPQLNQTMLGKVDNAQLQNLDLAAILTRLQADSETNKAQMESQKADMDRRFDLILERLERVKVH